MPITISIPTILRPLTDNQKRIEVDGSSVLDAIERMEQRYPGVKEKLVTGGQAHRFVNIYVNDNDIRFSSSKMTPSRETKGGQAEDEPGSGRVASVASAALAVSGDSEAVAPAIYWLMLNKPAAAIETVLLETGSPRSRPMEAAMLP